MSQTQENSDTSINLEPQNSEEYNGRVCRKKSGRYVMLLSGLIFLCSLGMRENRKLQQDHSEGKRRFYSLFLLFQKNNGC